MNILYIILIILSVIGISTLIMPYVTFFVALGFNGALEKLNSPRRWIGVISAFFKARAERQLFYAYLETMTVSALPMFGQLYVMYEKAENGNVSVVLRAIADNDITLSLVTSALITFGYCFRLYFQVQKDKNARAKEIAESLALINKEFTFKPNKEWFEAQSRNAITDLGSRYDKVHNLRNGQMDQILNVLRRENPSDLWIDDIESLLSDVLEMKKSMPDELQGKIQLYLETITKIINTEKWTSNEIDSFQGAFESMSKDIEEWHSRLSYSDRDYQSYHWGSYRDTRAKIIATIQSPWLKCMSFQTMLIIGEGGMGKSHLLGNIVDERTYNGDPTILILGAMIGDGEDPWNQILKLLDIKCKKSTFLESLESYSVVTGKRVQIVVDALNESSGGYEYWGKYITDFLKTIEPYQHVGLVLSLRTTPYNGQLDEFIDNDSHATYKVTGFSDNVEYACEYMFDSYELTPPDWYAADAIFQNPLWLHMYCDSHAMMQRPIERETHWQIVEHYIEGFNKVFAKKFSYAEDRRILRKVLFALVHLMVDKQRSYSMLYNEFYQELERTLAGEISTDLFLKEMLHTGMVQQNKDYKGEVILHFEFEYLGRYVYTYVLVTEFPEEKWKENTFFINELSEIVPEVTGREYFTYFENGEDEPAKFAFIETISYRNSLTPSGEQLLQLAWNQKNYEAMFRIATSCATNPKIKYNAASLYDVLYGMPMMERDAIWTPLVSEWSEINTNMQRIAGWGMKSSRKTIEALSIDVSRLMGECLVWCFCSTNKKLRDTATKALVNLLMSNSTILCELVDKYYAVNDPYVQERLWAVAFGCCTQSQNQEMTKAIAIRAYEHVFSHRPVVENILVRDYAKLIIEYAKHLRCELNIEEKSYLPPYNTYRSIPDISDKYIVETYENVYKNHEDSSIQISAMRLINSLIPEYSRRGIGGYGDFGRYEFQYDLNEFPEGPVKLSNWATEIIFKEFEYKPESVKHFDSHAGSYSNRPWERIGKKYEWLALYKIAAILSDYHAGEKKEEDSDEPIVTKMRNIDPTLLHLTVDSDLYKFHQLKYHYTAVPDKIWVQNVKYLPTFEDCLIQKDQMGVEWVNLYTYIEYTLRNSKLLENSKSRELWMFFQSCFVDKKNVKMACGLIKKVGLQGRSFSENGEVYKLYAGEWGWSDLYKKYTEEYKYEKRPFSISLNEEKYDMRPSMVEYFHEYVGDSSTENNEKIYYPNSHIVKTMKLMKTDMRGVWRDEHNEVAIYDNEVAGGKSALIIRKDILLKYLKLTDQVLIWPVLIEKRMKTWRRNVMGERQEIKQCGGYVKMNQKGVVTYKMRQYDKDPTKWDAWKYHCVTKPIKIIGRKLRPIAIKLHLIKVSEDEMFNFRAEELLRRLESGQAIIGNNENIPEQEDNIV